MEIRQAVPRDAIPGVDDPEFGPDYFGDPDDEVIVVEADDHGPDAFYRPEG